MTHPTNEEWMSLLYGEATGETRLTLEKHLTQCGACSERYVAWKNAAGELNHWKLASQARRRVVPLVRWAAAAAVAGLVVLGGARLWALDKEVKGLRAELRQQAATPTLEQLRSETREAINAMAADYEQKRQADRRGFVAVVEQLQAKNAESYASLRKALETVAILTEAGLRDAQSEIANISYAPRDTSHNQ